MFVEPTWLPTLIYRTKIGSLEHVRSWGLGQLLIMRKHIRKIQFPWKSLGALIELWHPQTHTFIFPSFEATILLEEIEILLGLRSSVDHDIACPLGDFHISDILGEFMSEKEIWMVATPNGMDLFLFSSWLLERSSDLDSLFFAKGLTICLVRSLLFPSFVSFLHRSSLRIIRELWREKSISQVVLAFLYSGLTTASISQRPYGSMIILSLWMDIHLCFRMGGAPTSSRIF